MTDVPDWNNSVQVTGGTVEVVGTTIIEPAAGSTFDVSGSVAVTGTTTIEPAAGSTFDISGPVTVTNTTTVEPAAGSTFDVSGSVAVTGTTTIEPAAGSTFDIAGPVTVSSGTLDVQNANIMLGVTDAVLLHNAVGVAVNLAPGASGNFPVGGASAGSTLIDRLLVLASFPNNDGAALQIVSLQLHAADPQGNQSVAQALVTANALPLYQNGPHYQALYDIQLPTPMWVGSNIFMVLKNTSGAAAINETVVLTTYGHFSVATAGPSNAMSVANPAAGADFSYTFTAAGRLSTCIAEFVSSATVANRVPFLNLKDASGNLVWTQASPAIVTASESIYFLLGAGCPWNAGPAGVSPLRYTLSLPNDVFVQPGWTLSSATTGIQATDQWENIFVTQASS